MARMILLVRGVNVGGVKLPMAGFRDMLRGLGLTGVQTYIQSGNAVFDEPEAGPEASADAGDLAARIGAGLSRDFGLSSALFLYPVAGYDQILARCPFASAADADGAKVHLFFLAKPVAPDLAALRALATTERFHLSPQALYLHAPDGIGRSALVEKLPRLVGGVMTARNWNTARALSTLAHAP